MKPLWISTIALALACAPLDPQVSTPLSADFPSAGYHRDCAPWDGPALSFLFAGDPGEGGQPSYPYMRISTYRPPALLEGTSFDWTGTDHNEGYAELCRAADDCEAPHAVHVDLMGVSENGRLEGEVLVRFVDGREIMGPFSAQAVPVSLRCG